MTTHNYKVSKNILLTPSVRSITLSRDEGARPLLFEPGQYVALSLHDRLRPTTTRCFSIASSPTNRNALEFSVRVGGDYTNSLKRLTVGDSVVVRGPFGSFVLKEHLSPRLVFFAGGIGITPFMSMIRYATELRLPNAMNLVYSCRNQNEIAYLDELVSLQRNNPNFHVTFAIGEGETSRLHGLDVIMGRIDAPTFKMLGLGHKDETYMLCGPSGYLVAMQSLLKSQNVSQNRILTESFNQAHSGDSMQVRWPTNMYALGGLSFMVASLFVVSSDLIKTLPTFEAGYEPVVVERPSSDIKGATNNTLANIEVIPPLVDTTITQEPITKHIPNPEVKTVVVATTPVATQKTTVPPITTPVVPAKVTPPKVVAPVVKPTPKPTPTVTTKTRPKTKVS